MKNIAIILAGLFLSHIANSQPIKVQASPSGTTPLTDVLSINLPAGAEKLSKEKFKTLTTSSSSLSEMHSYNKGDFFKLNSIMIVLNSFHGKLDQRLLSEDKAFSDYLITLYPASDYKSSITTINDNEVLIVSFIRSSKGHYNISCLNRAHSSVVEIRVAYDLSEKQKAETMVNDMLKSIKFK